MGQEKEEIVNAVMASAGRRSARAELEALIDHRHQDTMKLCDLLDVLPNKLPSTADEALWTLIISWMQGRVPDEPKESAQAVIRPQIICLCGSTRFVNEMAVLAWELEKDGNIVLGLHLLPANYPGVQEDHQAEAENVKEKMDALHLRKIDLADRIFVVNIGGYIGESTRSEIEYAKAQGKSVVYLEAAE